MAQAMNATLSSAKRSLRMGGRSLDALRAAHPAGLVTAWSS